MAATQSHAADLTSEEQPTSLEIMKEQPVAVKSETSSSFKAPPASAAMALPGKPAQLSEPYGLGGEWDEYAPYINAEGSDMTSPGSFNENTSLVFHNGYGYSTQNPYGPYSPAATPMPSMGGDGQLYSAQQFGAFSGSSPYYPQVVPHSIQYITSPTCSQPELTSLVGLDQQGDSMLWGSRPSFHSLPFTPNLAFPDWQPAFDDWSKPSHSPTHLPHLSPASSPHPILPLAPFGLNLPMGSHRQRSAYGSASDSYNRGYMLSGGHHHAQGSNYENTFSSNVGMANQGRGRLAGSSFCGGCNTNTTFDIHNEQNRGPRASKPKAKMMEAGLDSSSDPKINTEKHEQSYNDPEFVTDYNDAKFFIIKSYSEDNVHKSIKYSVWASTPTGNKKLDSAYREAKDKQEPCPVFLLFSVNASGQFCGVAEMVGAVDFEKSVDYWQQDKWSGQFPVTWHFIKDVPNSHFRHIILEHNDNKPVTNSRDTQEVKLDQGIEILKIFNSYEAETSILDDFEFYEEREKMMQERKARRQATVGEHEHKPASVALPAEFIKNMSKSFAEVVGLEEGGKEAGRSSSSPEASISSAQPHQ